MITPQLQWTEKPTLDDRSMPWRQLSSARLERRILLDNGEETKYQVITNDPRDPEFNIQGRIVYLVQPTPDKGKKSETKFHVTAYDNLVRGADRAYASLQQRSNQMAKDELTLQILCQLIGFNWDQVKRSPVLRMLVAGSLSPMSMHYERAKRKRLQVVAARTGSSVTIRDSLGRDNPLVTTTKLFWSRPGLVVQKAINDRAKNSVADRHNVALDLTLYVERLLTELVTAADAGSKGKFMRAFHELEEIVIFNPLVHGMRYCHQYMTGQRSITPEVMDHVASVMSAERLLCGLSELITLVRDEPELRVDAVFEQMRELVDWDDFSPTYSELSSQMSAEITVLEQFVREGHLINPQVKNMKSWIRDRRSNKSKILSNAREKVLAAVA